MGRSWVEPDRIDAAQRLLESSVKIVLPVDHVVAGSPEEPSGAETVEQIPEDRMALDIGPASIENIRQCVEPAASVFWNGPVGFFERPPFDRGTHAVAQIVAASSGYSVVGGGDSLAAIRATGVGDRISHLSTGGGASLEFLEGLTLPGIAALETRG